MPEIEEQLVEIEALLRAVKPKEAEERFRALLFAVGTEELSVWETDLRRTIDRFLKKRRKGLGAELDKRLRRSGEHRVVSLAKPDDEQLEVELKGLLGELAAKHIFQWSTFYRDGLSPFFQKASGALIATDHPSHLTAIVRREVAGHANNIFTRGYQRTAAQVGGGSTNAIYKTMGGLQQFLQLPIEFYSAGASSSPDKKEAVALRALCSAMLSGIIEGFGAVSLGPQKGWDLLGRHPNGWGQYIGFLTAEDLAATLRDLGQCDLGDALRNLAEPVVGAFDDILQQGTDAPVLPALGQLSWETRRFDASLRPSGLEDSSRFMEVQCYLNPDIATRPALQESASRAVSLIVCPMRRDIRDWVVQHPELKDLVVFVSQEDRAADVRRRSREVLEFALYKKRSPRAASAPLTYNFAREFPIHNPFLAKYFHVYRSSVSRLLRTFERRNGVRLWCSVRRSGKTTSCFDLGSTTGQSLVVSQTCDSTEQRPGASHFYELVTHALSGGSQIAKTFFTDAVHACAPQTQATSERYVFVLDEYETLFGRLRLAVKRNPELRFTVAQPLLGQMVAFTRDNLLVFLGQQPDAHFILMDQNQLSAYVEQDSFPLFTHNDPDGGDEFGQLLTRVLTERVSVEPGFADAVFHETAGHPFLTVKLLVEFVDWLIQKKRAIRDLRLHRHDLYEFGADRLVSSEISISPEYAFFREAIAEATSNDGKAESPWLFAVYSVLRQLCIDSKETLSCSRADFADIVTNLRLLDLGFTPDHVLTTASQANFLSYDGSHVSPKVRLLGRISAVARQKVRA